MIKTTCHKSIKKIKAIITHIFLPRYFERYSFHQYTRNKIFVFSETLWNENQGLQYNNTNQHQNWFVLSVNYQLCILFILPTLYSKNKKCETLPCFSFKRLGSQILYTKETIDVVPLSTNLPWSFKHPFQVLILPYGFQKSKQIKFWGQRENAYIIGKLNMQQIT